jgi:PqqD family protein of HPr-rel-A system
MDLGGTYEPEGLRERWIMAPAETILWRELDGELVVYLDEMGSTHLLGSFAGAILLTFLQSAPSLTLAELLDHLAPSGHDELDGYGASGAGDEPDPRQDPAAILQVMAEFERIGLVRQH